jgi:hypothetical protein
MTDPMMQPALSMRPVEYYRPVVVWLLECLPQYSSKFDRWPLQQEANASASLTPTRFPQLETLASNKSELFPS